MMEAVMDQTVAIYQLDRLDDRGEHIQIEALDVEGFEIRLLCHLEEKKTRTFSLDGVDLSGDATMVWVAREDGLPAESDLVVTIESPTAYRILSKESQKQMGTGISYSRATLGLTKLPIKLPREIGEGDGE